MFVLIIIALFLLVCTAAFAIYAYYQRYKIDKIRIHPRQPIQIRKRIAAQKRRADQQMNQRLLIINGLLIVLATLVMAIFILFLQEQKSVTKQLEQMENKISQTQSQTNAEKETFGGILAYPQEGIGLIYYQWDEVFKDDTLNRQYQVEAALGLRLQNYVGNLTPLVSIDRKEHSMHLRLQGGMTEYMSEPLQENQKRFMNEMGTISEIKQVTFSYHLDGEQMTKESIWKRTDSGEWQVEE